MDMEIAVLVGQADFLGVLFKGVARLDRSRQVEHESLEGMGHVGVFVHAPVRLVKVGVDDVLDVQVRFLLAAQLTALLAVQDVLLGDLELARLHQDLLDHVLDVLLLGDVYTVEFFLDLLGEALAEQRVLDTAGREGLENGLGDTVS